MAEAPKNKDQEKGDEVLRRLLNTRPDPKIGKEKAGPLVKARESNDYHAAAARR
ncbi:MAG: hypothetical protein WBA44_01760 [Mesorhizobium sp.]